VSARVLKPSAAIVLVALAVAACGSSTSSSSSSTAASASATASHGATSSTPSTTANSATTSSASTAASAATGSGCLTPNLRLSFVSGQGAAGTAYLTYQLTNTGSRSCTMFGYPGFSILNASGQIVQHPAKRGIPGPAPVKLVTLAPGQGGRFTVTSSDVIPNPDCQHTYTGTTAQVYPPNQRAALRIADRRQFCDLHVGPVQASG
jgi:hypothetical protein